MKNLSIHFKAASERHEASLAEYLRLAGALDASVWLSPVADGKWSPCEITEHLRATYALAVAELGGAKGLKPRVNFLVRTVLRFTVLPRIMKRRKLPSGAKAPSEIRPDNCVTHQSEALAGLRTAGEAMQQGFEKRLDDPTARLTHHLLGRFKPVEALEFLTIHLEHHTLQLPGGR